jgi:hypothetical protein
LEGDENFYPKIVPVSESFFSNDDRIEFEDILESLRDFCWYPYLSKVVLLENKFLLCTTIRNLREKEST